MCKIDLDQCEWELQFHRLKPVFKKNAVTSARQGWRCPQKKEMYEYS